MEPSTLSEIDINLHGFTVDDVIENRQAQRESIEGLRVSVNPAMREMYGKFRELELLGLAHGINPTYDENLDEDDLY